ncbi:hypothetical protein M5K25_026581 [Dendrobium thyrsiflorum]|uniref:Uncharacterized protein n=1 Tax=Dendrobium thyrsiflorum TaxID=117978 RepID=A0ABD0TXV4_DENTH
MYYQYDDVQSSRTIKHKGPSRVRVYIRTESSRRLVSDSSQCLGSLPSPGSGEKGGSGSLPEEERFSARGRAVLCRHQEVVRKESGSLPSLRSGEKGSKFSSRPESKTLDFLPLAMPAHQTLKLFRHIFIVKLGCLVSVDHTDPFVKSKAIVPALIEEKIVLTVISMKSLITMQHVGHYDSNTFLSFEKMTFIGQQFTIVKPAKVSNKKLAIEFKVESGKPRHPKSECPNFKSHLVKETCEDIPNAKRGNEKK